MRQNHASSAPKAIILRNASPAPNPDSAAALLTTIVAKASIESFRVFTGSGETITTPQAILLTMGGQNPSRAGNPM